MARILPCSTAEEHRSASRRLGFSQSSVAEERQRHGRNGWGRRAGGPLCSGRCDEGPENSGAHPPPHLTRGCPGDRRGQGPLGWSGQVRGLGARLWPRRQAGSHGGVSLTWVHWAGAGVQFAGLLQDAAQALQPGLVPHPSSEPGRRGPQLSRAQREGWGRPGDCRRGPRSPTGPLDVPHELPQLGLLLGSVPLVVEAAVSPWADHVQLGQRPVVVTLQVRPQRAARPGPPSA